MAIQKYAHTGETASVSSKRLKLSSKLEEHAQLLSDRNQSMEPDMDVDLKEIYFLMLHFLSSGPCLRTYRQFCDELDEHQLLPRRYHGWYSRSGSLNGHEYDDGLSFPLSYNELVERYPHIKKDHLVKLLKQLLLSVTSPSLGISRGNSPNASDVPTLLGKGSFSLLSYDRDKKQHVVKATPAYMHWPHVKADQIHGLSLREIGGGFSRHHRAPSVRAACYAIAKPATMLQKMQNIKRIRGHRNAVYCATFDHSGRYVITGSDDRLVKIWSMETAYCLASCRGHDGDITDLAVSSNDTLVASSSNDFVIRVWRLPDGLPISVLRGHTGAVTAIAFSPRLGAVYQLVSSSDDGTCRLWDARNSQGSPRVYVPRPADSVGGKSNGASSSVPPPVHQIFCCAFNANGMVFVTGSSDHLARVWSACKPIVDVPDQSNHEIDVLAGHENDVNYVQFSGCGVASRLTVVDTSREENIPKFKNSWFNHDNIVTCSRDGSAIIWIPKSRRSHGKAGRWIRAYHLRVPPPPMPSQPQRGGPRQRILPTPRGVNMIVWSLDNRFVLAAIMDCRICVWNATDGSLVHSLTGHTESTYVLDVHPFNPRIAMSAGYDGKTIVWDIWEGTPIRVYEISRFKLVDGKFSSDGTSIILSDDVGQLYILNTGQGESQNDAKYDQFFLGDYRPLIQDTNGNVLDQETQIIPYRRNMQDLLCDAAMIPYPEPYQSAYQKRRLGALGIEWRPSSLKLAVGPDFSLDPEYQMLPLADLDMLAEPLPEFIDVMDWEPENEVRMEDTDSEYNITEDYSSGGEQRSLNSNSSGESHCSTEDSEAEHTHLDSLRRSKRKKHKSETEIITSSGRRVKRKNLDECDGSDGNSIKIHRIRKARSGQYALKRKSSGSKSSRPQRAAARNALSLFSKITGTEPQTDGEDDDSLEGDMSESESTLQESNIESDDSGRDLEDKRNKQLKGKALSLDNCEDTKPCELHETQMNAMNRRKIILKLPSQYSSKPFFDRGIEEKTSTQADLGASSSKASERSKGNHKWRSSYQDSDLDENHETVERTRMKKFENVKNHVGLSGQYINMVIRWGGVKARTTKHLKVGDPSSSFCLKDKIEKENTDVEFRKADDTLEKLPTLDEQSNQVKIGSVILNNDGIGTTTESCNGVVDDKNFVGQCTYLDHGMEAPSTTTCSYVRFDRPDVTLSPKPRSDSNPMDAKSPTQLETSHVAMDQKVVTLDEGSFERETLRNEEDSGQETHSKVGTKVESQDSLEMHPRKDKMYNAVYRRSKSHKAKNIVADCDVGESSLGRNNINVNSCTSLKEDISGFRELKTNSCDSDDMVNNVKLHQQNGNAVNGTDVGSIENEQPLQTSWSPGLRTAVRLRSTRIKKVSYHVHETSPVSKKTLNQPARKGTWLMLSTQEEGCRYIPQLGDEVVYLRQGHKEYIERNPSKESVPWVSLKGEIRSVEYCRVEKLDYSTAPSGDGCCKLTLQFTDPGSSVFGKYFGLTLPEIIGLPDFLVERTRFDDAMQRNWTRRDKCRVWWNEAGSGGKWWEGRILSVQAKSSEFPESPWDSCKVLYKDEPTNGLYYHSPWELFDADAVWEQRRIPAESREKLLLALSKLNQPSMQDRYGVQELKTVSYKTKFINRFPVPLTLELIQSRLENNYYRYLEATKHDISVMLSNFKTYFEREAHVAAKLKRLSDWFTRALSSL